jgi:hypothetical protein
VILFFKCAYLCYKERGEIGGREGGKEGRKREKVREES